MDVIYQVSFTYFTDVSCLRTFNSLIVFHKKYTSSIILLKLKKMEKKTFKTIYHLLITTDANLFKRSPILWNIISPNGMPTIAYAIQNALPPIVTGVECP